MAATRSLYRRVQIAKETIEAIGTDLVWERLQSAGGLSGDARLLAVAALEAGDDRFEGAVAQICQHDYDGVVAYARVRLDEYNERRRHR